MDWASSARQPRPWRKHGLTKTRKNYSKPEAHLKRPLELPPLQIGAFIDLARLFTRQGRYPEADLSLAKAEQIAPHSAKLMFAKADLYIKGNRNLDVARELLKHYISMVLTPDDPPRADAEKPLTRARGSQPRTTPPR